jgi:glycosyltransferase involved in cell wall biosynthesis
MTKLSVITPSIRPQGLEITRQSLLSQTFRDFEWLVDINWTGKHDLNASLNRLLLRSKGEIVVFLQDYIKIEPDALQRVIDTYKNGIFFTYPVGKTNTLDYSGNVKWDWRKHKQGEVHWQQWEIDFGSCSRQELIDIGGFDEELDKYWSCDNVNVGCRADLAGYKFECVDIPAIAYDHDAFIEHPFRKNYNPNYNNERMDLFRRGLKLTLN